MKFLLFSDSAETHFRVRKIVEPSVDSLVTTKDESLFLKIIHTSIFDLFLIDLDSKNLLSNLREKVRECKLRTPWILFNLNTKLSTKNYINYWKAFNGIGSSLDDCDSSIEEKLKLLVYSISAKPKENHNYLKLSKNAKKLFDFFVKYQNKSISCETLENEILGEISQKNTNILYGLIHEIRKAIGDDLKKPQNLIRCKKRRYKLLNAFPEKFLDICVYGQPVENDCAKCFPEFYAANGYDIFPPTESDEYELIEQDSVVDEYECSYLEEYLLNDDSHLIDTGIKEISSIDFPTIAQVIEMQNAYSEKLLRNISNFQYIKEAIRKLNEEA